MIRAALVGALLAAGLAAPAALGTAEAETETPERTIVPVAKVFAAFAQICLDTAPDFAGADARLAEHGMTRTAPTGTVYHPSGTVSVKIHTMDGAGGQRRRCSVVYEDPDREAALVEIDGLRQSLGVQMFSPRGTTLTRGDGSVRRATVWTLEIGGQRGTFIHMPFDGGRDLGALIAEFGA